MEEIIVRKTKMPTSVKGVTIVDANDDYNVYINEEYSYEVQKEALYHEMSHIERKHFCAEKSVRYMEDEVMGK